MAALPPLPRPRRPEPAHQPAFVPEASIQTELPEPPPGMPLPLAQLINALACDQHRRDTVERNKRDKA